MDNEDHQQHQKYKAHNNHAHSYRHSPNQGNLKTSSIERILTPGVATNNLIKTAATGIITGGTLLLMGIYGLFSNSLGSTSTLPFLTIVFGTITTACVWIFGRPKAEEERNAEINRLNKQIKTLNQTVSEMQSQFDGINKRLSNAEYIEAFEERLARKELDQKISSHLPQDPTNTTAQSPSPPPMLDT